MDIDTSSPQKLEIEQLDKGMVQEGQSPTKREGLGEPDYMDGPEEDQSIDQDVVGDTIDQPASYGHQMTNESDG